MITNCLSKVRCGLWTVPITSTVGISKMISSEPHIYFIYWTQYDFTQTGRKKDYTQSIMTGLKKSNHCKNA